VHSHRGILHDETVEGERELGDVGSRVVFENERVRIWRLKLAPGERSAVHRHDLDHVLVQIRGDRIAVEPEPDTTGPFTETLAADVIAGMATFVPRGGVETAVNVGDDDYLEIIVELKD
jgi:hypothetical protein